MATDVERLVVSLEASITKYERAMQRALGQTNQTARRIESRFERMNRGLGSSFVALQRGIATAFAGVAATRGATQLLDSATRLENALKVTGLAGEELDRVYRSLFNSAQRNLAPIDTLVDLYSRLGLAQAELGVTNQQLEAFVDRTVMALRVQGTTAEEARGALIQLGQAMGEGVFRAQEFNSIIEQAPAIHRAAAAGLEEAGGSVAALRQIMLEGRLSSRAYFDALLAGSHILEDQLANAEVTVSQAFVRLRNVLIDVAREMNEGSTVSNALAGEISTLGDNIRELGAIVEGVTGSLGSFFGALDSGLQPLRDASAALRDFLGIRDAALSGATAVNNLNIPGLTVTNADAQQVIERTFSFLGETPQDEALARALAGEEIPQITVSLADYPAVPGSGGGGAGGAGRSGGGGTNPAERFQEALEAQQRRLDLLNQETALLRGANPLLNDYGYSLEQLRVQQELLNAAEEAGLEITPGRLAAINELATGMATATAEAARLAESQQYLVDTVQQFSDTAQNVMSGFINDLVNGTSAADALANALANVGQQLLNFGLNTLFGGIGGGGGIGSLIGGLFGFSQGTANTGGRRGEVRGIVHGQEAVIPLPNGGRVPVEVRSQGAASQGPIPIEVFVSPTGEFDARVANIADGRATVKVSQGIKAYDRSLPSRMSEIQERGA